MVEKLNSKDYTRYLNYACYERYILYIIEKNMHYEKGPVLFSDRIFNWEFDYDLGPLINKFDFFNDIYKKKFILSKTSSRENVKKDVITCFENMNKVMIRQRLIGTIDGLPYASNVLVEHIDSKYVYITKFTGDSNFVKKPIEIKEFFETLFYDEEGITYEEILVSKMNDDVLVNDLNNLINIVIPSEVLSGKEKPTTRGIKDLALYYTDDNNYKNLIKDNILAYKRIRMSRMINCVIFPSIESIELLIENNIFNEEVSLSIVNEVDKVKQVLSDLQKYSSLFFIKKERKFIDKYVEKIYLLENAIRNIQELMTKELKNSIGGTQ